MNGVNTLNIKYIWVTFRKEGIHKYPDAPEGVTFLKFPHRHIFHFKVKLEVFHDDREVEFILFKRELEALYDDETLQLNNMSCEMIAKELLNKYKLERCSVFEDNENGAVVYK